MGTGELVYFGEPIREGGCERHDGSSDFEFPTEMGAVNIKCLCSASMLLLDNGEVYRFEGASEHNAAFEELGRMNELVVAIACGKGHFLCHTEKGSVYCFGDNRYGQLGLGHTRQVQRPTTVVKFDEIGEKVKMVAAGKHHSLALTDSGRVYAWGDGSMGQVGSTPVSRGPQLAPKFVSRLRDAEVCTIVCGDSFSAVLTLDGRVFFWGADIMQKHQLEPIELKFPADVEIVELVGAFTHLVASDAEGCAYTCGHGTHGQLGHGESRQNTVSYRPRRVDSLRGKRVRHVFASAFYSAFLTNEGELFTCGSGRGGKLGHGMDVGSFEPRRVDCLEGKPVGQLVCGPDRLLCMIPTFLKAVSPTCASVDGGTTVTIAGVGLYETGQPVQVRLVLGDSPVYAAGVFNADDGSVSFECPSIRAALEDQRARRGVAMCHLSLSLDGRCYSNELPLYFFSNPTDNQACLLNPSHGPLHGGTDMMLTANFDVVPYGGVRVKFRTEQQELVVDAEFDENLRCLTFISPEFECDEDICVAKVDVSLDGQQFVHMGSTFSFYKITLNDIYPPDVPLSGSKLELQCSGVHFTDHIQVRFEVDQHHKYIVEAHYYKKSQLAPLADDDDEEDVDPTPGAGFLWCVSPSFKQFGSCDVALSVCINGQDFVSLNTRGLLLQVQPPSVQRLRPMCGPKGGDTIVELLGQNLYYASDIEVRLDNAARAGEEAVVPFAAGTERRTGEFRDRTGGAVVDFKTPAADAAGVANVQVAFDPEENSFSREHLKFVYYDDPEITEISPSAVAPSGNEDVGLLGTGLVDSADIAVRLTLLPAGEKKAPPAKAAKGKKGAEEPSPVEMHVPQGPLPAVVVRAKYVVPTTDESAANTAKGPKKSAKGAAKAPAGDEKPFLSFITPPASAFVEDGNTGADDDGDGRELMVELALNGQQFIKLEQTLTYAGAGAASAAAAKGKKKK